MRFRPAAGIGFALLALVAAWPFWYGPGRNGEAGGGAGMFAESIAAASAPSVSEAPAFPPVPVCSGCGTLKRLARRLRAREEGAARRFEAAAGRLAARGTESSAPGAREELEFALRMAQDDKRGAAVFRAAVLEAVTACEQGPGCGEAPLSGYWEAGCPPEQPDLGRETRTVAALSRVLADKAAFCAAAACPEIDCGNTARISGLLSAADRHLKELENTPAAEPGSGAAGRKAARELFKASEDWRGRVAALFLGGPKPSAQILAAAESARALAIRMPGARADAEPSTAGGDPYWRLQVLSVRLDRMAGALEELATAMDSDAPERDAVLFEVRGRAANAFHDLIIAQMRIHSAFELAGAGPEEAGRCARRRQNQIARARGQIRAMRAALARCAGRAACLKQAERVSGSLSLSGLDPVSARRLQLDQALGELKRAAPALKVEAQGNVKINTGHSRFENGEAVPVRIDLRSTACMADEGAWVGLFPKTAAPLRGSESMRTAIRRLDLRGRPWEEVLFEAPPTPGAYEVRTYAAERRGGAITGRAQFDVTQREEGCRGFSGVWRTSFGRLRISIRDGEARGSYKKHGDWRAGFLTGKVNGRVLFGEWQSDLGAGGTRLVLSEDGKSFSGTWSHFRDEFAGTGVWNGKCAGPVKAAGDGER